MRISIEGLDNVSAMIQSRIEKIQNELPQAIAEGGKVVEGNAKALCPVDTGNLRGSIKSQSAGNTAVIGTNVDYAGYVELGTYKMAAQPYLVPALKNSQSAVIAAIKSRLL